MRLIHLTDPHLCSLEHVAWRQLLGKRLLGYCSWQRRRRHHHTSAALARISEAVCAEQADVVMVTGDLCQLGTLAELSQARAWLDQLAAHSEVLVVPGNHDLYQADSAAALDTLWFPYTGIEVADYPRVKRFDDLCLIGLCSARPQPWYSAAGEIDAAQLQRLEQILRQHSDAFRIVMTHHPMVPGMCTQRKALRNAATVYQLLQEYQTEVLLHGHIHRNETIVSPSGLRSYATASASNVHAGREAAYRVFDIDAREPFAASMTLKQLSADGDNIDVIQVEQFASAAGNT